MQVASLKPGERLYLTLLGQLQPMLNNTAVCPSDKQSIKDSNTIGDDLIERAERSRKLGHRNVEIELADEALLTLENKIEDLLSLKERKEIISDLLTMVREFPTSNPEKAVSILISLLKREELKEFPSVLFDSHKMLLEALIKQLDYTKDKPTNLTQAVSHDFTDVRYAVSAINVLFKFMPDDALLNLPAVIRTIANNKLQLQSFLNFQYVFRLINPLLP